MLTHLPITLTSRDHAVLEGLLVQWEPFGATELLRHKLSAATIVFPADVPPDVVTINSRIRFRDGDGRYQERTIVADPSEEVYGLTLTLSTPRGLAIVGMRAGQTVQAARSDGSVEELTIEAILYQPERARTRPALSVVSSQDIIPSSRAATPGNRPRTANNPSFDDDDPGPSAA